jgi:hypothetical protein
MHREEVIRARRPFLTLTQASYFLHLTYYAARSRYVRGLLPAVARSIDGNEFRAGSTPLVDAFALRKHLPRSEQAVLTDWIAGRCEIPIGAKR